MNQSKKDKFQELEDLFSDNLDMINFSKSQWLTSRGLYYAKQGDFYKAIDDFKEAIFIKSDNVAPYMAMGIVYKENKMFNKAIEILEKTPIEMTLNGNKIKRPDFDFYAALGAVYSAKGDKEKAAENIKKAFAAANDEKVRLEGADWADLFGNVEELKRNMEGALKEIENGRLFL